MTLRQRRLYIGCLFSFVLAVLVAGCSGDSAGVDGNVSETEDGNGGGDTPSSGASAVVLTVTADPGLIIAVPIGGTVVLDGSESKASLDEPLTYAWSFVYKPALSIAELLNATDVSPSFVADVKGTYTVQLVVSAGGVSSERAILSIESNNEEKARATGKRDHTSYQFRCSDCHDSRYDEIADKSQVHIATSNICQACHTTFGFELLLVFDHQEAFGKCRSCHDGVQAIGPSRIHVVTTADCDDCHNTTEFLELGVDGSYDHVDVGRDCDVCHNGTIAIGKHDDHLPTEGDCSLCHITDNFQDNIFDHSNIVDDCATCHNGTFVVDGNIAVGIPPIHPVTTADCGQCHTTETFTQAGIFDHTAPEVLSRLCGDCHNNINVRGKSRNHMPTTEDCGECHTPGDFSTGTFDHVDIVDTCVSCHDGIISTDKPVKHIPTEEDCAACHLTVYGFETFAFPDGVVFNHAGIDENNCALCHNGDFNNTIKPAEHIPTLDDCSVCHVVSGEFKPSKFYSTVHLDIADTCEGCHNGNFPVAAGKDVINNHLPTNQDCHVCHTKDVFMPSKTFTHAGISSNCVSCHDGNYTEFRAVGTAAKTNPSHVVTNLDCGICHNITGFTPAFVDHTSTEVMSRRCDFCHNGTDAIGKDSGHVPTSQDCGVCHVPGTFATAVFNHAGIVNNCARSGCHDGTSATSKSSTHIQTLDDCSVCHNTTAFAGARFDHRGITNNCATCHDGITATGKRTTHVPTNADCSECHKTTGFIPASFDHIGIIDNCRSCHDGVFAQGKTRTHITTNEDCVVCHVTTGFIPAAGFDHTGIVNNCTRSGCHGSGARGKPLNHVDTNQDCSVCHTTATFVGGRWIHATTDTDCRSCHNGTIATGKSSGHFVTSQQCSACHTTRGWGSINFTHQSSRYPGNHNSRVTCRSCHTSNNEAINFPSTLYIGSCAACHAGDYRSGEHDGTSISQNRNCGQSGCHRVSSNGF